MDLAIEEKRQIDIQKGFKNPTTLNLAEDRDITGSLCQNGVFKVFDDWGIGLEEKTSYFDALLHKDLFDYRHRGGSWDIKGNRLKDKDWAFVAPKSRMYVALDDKDKPMDGYTFAKYDPFNNLIHIAGVIGYHEFWDIAKEWEQNNKVYYCLAYQLKDFRSHVFGT